MTFTETIDSGWLVSTIVLIVMFLLPMLPRARSGIISIYDAGIFAVYLVVLAWGVLTVVEGKETVGWILIIKRQVVLVGGCISCSTSTNANSAAAPCSIGEGSSQCGSSCSPLSSSR
jgi:hypothetical protein